MLLVVNELSDLVSEVLFSLLDTLALFVTNEALDRDVAAESLCGVLNVLGNLLVILSLNVLHINEAVVVIELAKLTGDNTIENLLGLTCHLGIVCELSLDDLLLIVENLCGNAGSVEVRSGICTNLESDVLCELCKLCVVSTIGVELNDLNHTITS